MEVLRGHTRCCRTVAFSHDGRLLVSGGDDKRILVWRVEDWKQFRDPIKTGVAIVCVAISPDSTQILASTRKGELKTWDLETGKLLYTIKTQQEGGFRKLSFEQTDQGYVMTELGAQLLASEESGGAIAKQPPSNPYAIKLDRSTERWTITWKGHRVIQIHDEYKPNSAKPASTCVAGRKIAIGCALGEVSLYGFSEDKEPPIKGSMS